MGNSCQFKALRSHRFQLPELCFQGFASTVQLRPFTLKFSQVKYLSEIRV
jgi:hypothetical protein